MASEPSDGFPFVIVSVRHLTFGIIKRRFAPDCKVRAVYDWVGSLATTPEDFSLSLSHPRIKVRPNDNISLVSSSVLHMSEEDQYLIPEDGVADKTKAQGGPTSTHQHNSQDHQQGNEHTDDILILEDTSPTPPMQLLEEDDDVLMTESSPARLFISLTEKRKNAAKNFNAQECNVYEVDRHNCFENLLSIYKDESITKQNISLHFKNEDADGDGIFR